MIDVLVDDDPVTRYIEEILAHAGLPWRRAASADVILRRLEAGIVVLVGRGVADQALRDWLHEVVRGGGVVIAVGGAWGMEDLFGVRESGVWDEGYVRADADHPITGNLTSSLHAFEAAALHATTGTSLGVVLDSRRQEVVGDAIVVNRVGGGVAVAIAANVAATVHRIQQGATIHADGLPAPDGTAPIDDGILKCDDGIVLSWEFDRDQTVLAAEEPDCPGKHPDFPAGDTPWFAQPVGDEWRALLVQAICWAASEVGLPLPLVWPWPRGLPAVGMISHDSDLNIDATARTTLRLLEEVGIHSTWCMMEGPTYPDRFSPETFDLVARAGHETALHYNAHDGQGGHWGKDDLVAQAAWLRRTAGVERIASNKNHYTRWEGDVEFFYWLEDAGIANDQTKGPSKKGNVGYPFGSCQPWFPYDLNESRFIDVLEIPLQTQDLWLTTPCAIAAPILDQTVKHHGIAHFLFHQVHLDRRPAVADAMRRAIAEGRRRGIEWWTSERINAWERLRRGVAVSCKTVEDTHVRLQVETGEPVPGFGVALLLPVAFPAEVQTTAVSPACAIKTRSIHFHGRRVPLLQWDLARGTSVIEIRPA